MGTIDRGLLEYSQEWIAEESLNSEDEIIESVLEIFNMEVTEDEK